MQLLLKNIMFMHISINYFINLTEFERPLRSFFPECIIRIQTSQNCCACVHILILSSTLSPKCFTAEKKQPKSLVQNCLTVLQSHTCLRISAPLSQTPQKRIIICDISLPAHETRTEVTVLGIRSCSPQPK